MVKMAILMLCILYHKRKEGRLREEDREKEQTLTLNAFLALHTTPVLKLYTHALCHGTLQCFLTWMKCASLHQECHV